MRKLFTILLVLLAAMLTSVSAFAQLEDPKPAADAAFVRFGHLSSGTPAIKGFVDGSARISGLAYGTVTRWLDVAPGSHDFAIGTGSDPAAAQLSGIALDLAPGSFTTILAVGSGDSLQSMVIEENYGRIRGGNARVTAVNALEGTGAPVNFTVGGGSISYVAFPGTIASRDGFDTAEVAPGTGVRVTGFNTGTVYAEDANRAITAGHNYLVVVSGSADNARLIVVDTDQAEFSTPDFSEGEARVRIGHLSVATPPVTVFVDGTAVLSGIRYGFVTRYLPITAGTHEIAIGTNSNIAAAIIGPVEVTFEDGSFTTIAAVGDSDGGVTSVILNDFTGASEDAASATVYHGIAGGPSIDVWAGDVKLVEGLAFAGSFLIPAGGFNDGIDEVEVEPGEVTVTVTAGFAGSPANAILSRDVTFTAGHYYLIAVVGTPNSPRLIVTDVDPAVDLED